jgi:hypothetical protein
MEYLLMKAVVRLGIVALTFNPNNLEGRDRRTVVRAQLRRKVTKILSQKLAGNSGSCL